MIFQASSQRKLCRSTRMRISSVTARLGWVSLSCTAAFEREAAQLAVGGKMALDQILQRGGDEEIFLAQPQFAARRALVVRIEEFADRFRARFLGDWRRDSRRC